MGKFSTGRTAGTGCVFMLITGRCFAYVSCACACLLFRTVLFSACSHKGTAIIIYGTKTRNLCKLQGGATVATAWLKKYGKTKEKPSNSRRSLRHRLSLNFRSRRSLQSSALIAVCLPVELQPAVLPPFQCICIFSFSERNATIQQKAQLNYI